MLGLNVDVQSTIPLVLINFLTGNPTASKLLRLQWYYKSPFSDTAGTRWLR